MGWVIERPGPDGKTLYMSVYRDLQGRQRSAGTWPTEKRAIAEWHLAEAAINAGKVGDPKRGRQRLRDYVENEWFPNHVIEASTRENYRYWLDKYLLPGLGFHRMVELLPFHVREWITALQADGVRPPTIREVKVVLDAILTTALNEQVVFFHAGRGVRTPVVAKKARRIITVEQYDAIQEALSDQTMQLLVETDIESGLRWGELTELRVKDLDLKSGLLTVARVVVELKSKSRPNGVRFLLKEYPKDGEWRQFTLAPHLVERLKDYITRNHLGPEDLLFELHQSTESRVLTRPDHLPDPSTLGLTEPNAEGRRYQHGTTTAYGNGRCRCQHCKNAVASYRAARRASGKDHPTRPRRVATDGHIPNNWFRNQIWKPALKKAELGFHVTPHGLRHAHASWILAGGADIRVVQERLGHSSITTTEKYLHSMPGKDVAALNALDVIRGKRTQQQNHQTGEFKKEDRTPEQRELAELRETVAKFKEVLGSMGSTR